MSKVNVMLMTFIFISFSAFKLLFLQGSSVPTDECSVGSLALVNCFIGVGLNCKNESGDYVIVQNGTVCINIAEVTSPAAANCNSIFDVGACIEYLANTIFVIFKIIVEFILVILSFVVNILVLVVLYLSLGLTPLPGAPFIINLLFIGPFIVGNLILIISFIPGE